MATQLYRPTDLKKALYEDAGLKASAECKGILRPGASAAEDQTMTEFTSEKLSQLANLDITGVVSQGSGRVEENVKVKIVLPLLELLGYDTTRDMHFEWRVAKRFADIAVIIQGNPELIVEVKDLTQNLDEHVEQALHYAFLGGVNYVMLTNGAEIRLYKSYVPYSTLKDRLICSIALRNLPRDFAQLAACVSKNNLEAKRSTFTEVRAARDFLQRDFLYLNGILEDISQQPTKGELLNRGLTHQNSYRYQEAISDYRKCLASDVVSTNERIVLQNFIGNSFFYLCRMDEAYASFLEAFRLASDLQDVEGIACFYANAAAIYLFQGKLSAALESVERALAISKETKNRLNEAQLGMQCGKILRIRGDVEGALRQYEAALLINREIAYGQGEAHALDSIARLKLDQGLTEEATRFSSQALDINRGVQYRPGEAANLDTHGMIARTQGKLEDALKCFKLSLEINRFISNRRAEASNYYSIGKVLRDQGQLDEAMRYLEHALSINREIGYRQGEAANLGMIARVTRDQGVRPEEVAGGLEEALRIQRSIGDRKGEAATLESLGRILLTKQRTSEALGHFTEALEINRSIQHRQGEAASLSMIARIRASEGLLDDAISSLNGALDITRSIGHRKGEAANLDALGRFEIQQGRLDEALLHLDAALKINREIGQRQGEATNLYNMAVVHEARKDYRVALSLLRQSRVIFNEINVVYKFGRISRKIRKITQKLRVD